MRPPINRLPRARPVPDAAARPAPDAAARPVPDAVARPVPDAILLRLTDLARVPADQRQFFFDSVRRNVQLAWELDALVKPWLTNKNGAALRVAALDLYEVLGNLNKDERKSIGRILDKSGVYLRQDFK